MDGLPDMRIVFDAAIPASSVSAELQAAPPAPLSVDGEVGHVWEALRLEALGRGAELFDGPTLRVIEWKRTGDAAHPGLTLSVTPSTYRYKAVAMSRPDSFAARAIHANGLHRTLACGALLRTRDDRLVLPLRGARVAAAGRWHLVAGHPEPPADSAAPVDLLGEMKREVRDELGVDVDAATDWRCIGLLSTEHGGAFELLLCAQLQESAAELQAGWRAAREAFEHSEIAMLPATADVIVGALVFGIRDRGGATRPLTDVARLALERWRVIQAT